MTVPSYSYTLVGAGVVPFPGVSSQGQGKALPIGRDLFLDETTGDLRLVAGDLSLVADGKAIRQEVEIRLRFLLGEWKLDTTVGVPYLQRILVKNPNLTAIRTILRDAILESAGIDTLVTLDLDFNRSTRTLRVTWSATTDLGELIQSEVTV